MRKYQFMFVIKNSQLNIFRIPLRIKKIVEKYFADFQNKRL